MPIFKLEKIAITLLFLCVLGAFGIGRDSLAKNKNSYKAVLKAWTRSASFYDKSAMEANVKLTATYQSPAFLDARRDEQVRRFDWQADDARAFDETVLSVYRDQPTFFVALYTHDREWNALDKTQARAALWRLELREADQSCAPLHIVKHKKPTPELYYFFPYIEKWDTVYLVTFPAVCRPDELESFSLVLSGVYGQVELLWK